MHYYNTISKIITICFLGLTLGCSSEDDRTTIEGTYTFDKDYVEDSGDYRAIISPSGYREPIYNDKYNPSSYWYLTSGKVKFPHTWNRRDYAYELIGKPTTLSTGYFDNYSFYDNICLRFLMDRTSKAKLELWVDYLELDYWVESDISEPLPISYTEARGTYQDLPATERQKITVKGDNWELVKVPVPVGSQWVDTIALHLVKKGSGSIFLKNVEITSCDNTDNSEKETDVSCKDDDDCSGISICGYVARLGDRLDDTRGCVVPHAKYLEAQCVVDEECADGICHEGVCSTCSNDEVCGDEGSCTQASKDEFHNEKPGPYQCNPRQGVYADGERCYHNSDCETGRCLSQVPESERQFLEEYSGSWLHYVNGDEIPYGICERNPDSDMDAGEESDTEDASAP